MTFYLFSLDAVWLMTVSAGSTLCIQQVASKRSSDVKYFTYDLGSVAILNCLNYHSQSHYKVFFLHNNWGVFLTSKSS